MTPDPPGANLLCHRPVHAQIFALCPSHAFDKHIVNFIVHYIGVKHRETMNGLLCPQNAMFTRFILHYVRYWAVHTYVPNVLSVSTEFKMFVPF